MATKSELATKILQKLTVLEADQTEADAPNDSTLVQAKYDSVYEALAAEDLVNWGSGDNIPTAAVIPVVGLVARECIEEFTVPMVIAQMLILDEDRYKNMLKRLEYNYYVPDSEAEYY